MTKTRGFKFVNEGLLYGNPPQRQTKYSAAYDLESIKELVAIEPGETKLIKTGLTAYMPDNEYLQILSRSGLAYKCSVFVINAPGIVDKDYEGNEIGVLLHNAGDKPFIIRRHDRIAQAIFSRYLTVDNDNPKDQERQSGFGHTGL